MESLLDKCLKASSKSNLSNYQIKSNESNCNNQEYSDCALNFSLLNSEKALEILKSNNKLKNDFYKFELYRQSSFNKDITEKILYELVCPSSHFDDIIDYCFETDENKKLLENIIKINKKMIMENQVSKLLIKLLKSENLPLSDSFKLFGKNHNLKIDYPNYQIYLIWLLLIQNPNTIDMNLLYKSLIKEINLKGLDLEVPDNESDNESNDEDLFSFSKKFEIAIIIDLVYIMFNLIKIISDEYQLKVCFKYFNIFSKILFHYIKNTSTTDNSNNFKKLKNFYEDLMKDGVFKERIELLKSQDDKLLRLKSRIDNFYMIKKFYYDKENRGKHFITDVINI